MNREQIKIALSSMYGKTPKGRYLFLPVRMPGNFTILSWIIYCPDGNVYSETSFDNACVRMDLNACSHGKQEVA